MLTTTYTVRGSMDDTGYFSGSRDTRRALRNMYRLLRQGGVNADYARIFIFNMLSAVTTDESLTYQGRLYNATITSNIAYK